MSATLLGSHGQDLVKEGLTNIDLEGNKNSNKNTTRALKNNSDSRMIQSIHHPSISSNSIVSIVMLLCSQEWQNSIQKNAGLAFIELINEGRVFCHNMKDNIVQVAKTAEAILQRQKAEIIKQHAGFQQTCAIEYEQQRQEDGQYDQLINAREGEIWLLGGQNGGQNGDQNGGSKLGSKYVYRVQNGQKPLKMA